ncbi:MAG: hypothetical protein GF332_03815 [Candidatus Moranbacteria bacterium]|nr:hypothetical protein [Candidatus Moranbacteria bacterium]
MKSINTTKIKPTIALVFAWLALPLFTNAYLVVTDDSRPLTGLSCTDQGAENSEQCYNDLDDAIDAAQAGQTIMVKQGEYTEHLEIDKPLKLECEDQAIIKNDDGIGILVKSQEVEINNCELEGFQKAIVIENQEDVYSDIKILNNKIHDLKSWDEPDKTFYYANDAIAVGYNSARLDDYSGEDQGNEQTTYDRLEISGNHIYNCFNGISLRFVTSGDFVKVVNNQIHNCAAKGILVDSSGYIDILANKLKNNGLAGIFLASTGDYPVANQADYAANAFWTAATGSFSPNGLYIQNNKFLSNGGWDREVLSDGTPDLYRNSIAGNGITVIGAASSIYINKNFFQGNVRALTNITSSLIDALGNDWGDSSGPLDDNLVDLNNDGAPDDPDGSFPQTNSGTGDRVSGAFEYDLVNLPEIPGQVGWGSNEPDPGYAGDGSGIEDYITCAGYLNQDNSYHNLWADAGSDFTYERQLYYSGSLIDTYDHNENYTGQFTPLNQPDNPNGGQGHYFIRVRAIDSASNKSVSDDMWAIIKPEATQGTGTTTAWCSMTIDTIKPGALFSSTEPDPTTSSNFVVKLEFQEQVSDLKQDDFILNNCALKSISTQDYVNYELTIEPQTEGFLEIELKADAVKDQAGNSNDSAFYSHTYSIPPQINFTDDIEAGPVQVEHVMIQVNDPNLIPSSLVYAFSVDQICDATDIYNYQYTNGLAFSLSGNIMNNHYICARASDTFGNIAYQPSQNPLNLTAGMAPMPKPSPGPSASPSPEPNDQINYQSLIPILEINQGDASTDDREVELEIYPPAGFEPYQMMISNNISFSDTSWEAYSNFREWELTQDQEEKAVYVKLKDPQGNITGIAVNHIDYEPDDYEYEYQDDTEDDQAADDPPNYYKNETDSNSNNDNSSGSGFVSSNVQDDQDYDTKVLEDYDPYEEMESEQSQNQEPEDKDILLSSGYEDDAANDQEFQDLEQEDDNKKSLIGSIFWPNSLLGKIFSLIMIISAIAGLVVITKNKLDQMDELDEEVV